MACDKCDCETAECYVGNFWRCQTPGCKNGPPPRPKRTTEPWPTLEWADEDKTPTDCPGILRQYGLRSACFPAQHLRACRYCGRAM